MRGIIYKESSIRPILAIYYQLLGRSRVLLHAVDHLCAAQSLPQREAQSIFCKFLKYTELVNKCVKTQFLSILAFQYNIR